MNGATHIAPHASPMHVALVCGGAEHGEQDKPHVAGSLLSTHAPAQR
jgi:hypothetical protein